MKACREAVSLNGRFNVALAGGLTPARFYRALCEDEFSRKIDWASVRVFFGDERAASPDHRDSNYRMASECLLQHVPIPESQVHRMEGERENLASAAAEYGRLLSSYLAHNAEGVPILDLILLGIGADGHVASLFADSPAVEVADQWAVANEAPGAGAMRLTLTFPVIHASRGVWLLCSGEGKSKILAEVARQVIEDNPSGKPAARAYPFCGDWRWYCDEAAASGLPPQILRRNR